MTYKLIITYENKTDSPVTIINEPWADETLIRPSEKAVLIFNAPDPNPLITLHQTTNELIFFTETTGAVTYVMRNGVEPPQAEQI